MNQWPTANPNAMFPPNTPGHLNPAAIYGNLANTPTPSFDINQFTQGLQNGHSASPSPAYPNQQQQQQQAQQQPQQSFQPGSVIPAKRAHDGMSASPIQQQQQQGSRSQTPSYPGYPNPQAPGQQYPNAPTPFQHLQQQTGSNNATPSPTMQNQQFRPPTQQQQQQPQQNQQSRMQNASPSPFPPNNFGAAQISPGTPLNQNQGMAGMMQQNQMGGGGFNAQFGMHNMSMPGMPNTMQSPMGNMGAGMPTTAQQAQQAYQIKLMQHQQALQASGMMGQRSMAGQQQQRQQQQQQQQQPQQQNPMFNAAAQAQMGGQMPNGQMAGQMNLNQQKMQQQQQQQNQKRTSFLKTIAAHAAQQGRQINLNPSISGRPVDLYVLWWLLTSHFGGSTSVEANGQWPAVASKMGFAPGQYPTAGEELKQIHMSTIAQYERIYFAMRNQQKHEQARNQASQMAGMAAASQGSPTRMMQPPNAQAQYPQFQQGQQAQSQPQPQPHATPVQANAQLPQGGMATPQQQMMQNRRSSSVRKPEQMTPQQVGAPAVMAPSPHSAGTVAQPPTADSNGVVKLMKSDEPPDPNYVPIVRALDSDGGYRLAELVPLGTAIARAIPNMPTLDEMGVIDTKAITLSLASGIHSEVRYALDALAIVTNDPRIKPELPKWEDLLDVIVDCAEDQIDILAGDETDVSDSLDLPSYEDVMRGGRGEAEALQNVPPFGTPAYDLDRAAERLIALSTILRNCSFFEENHRLLTSAPVVKWLSNTIRLLGTRKLFLRSFHNTQDFYKDMITFLSNVTQSMELPGRDDALHILHFLLAFAPQPVPRYVGSGGRVRFVTFVPAIHKYLPPAVDCLAKLLARSDPNRTFYKSMFAASSSPTAITEHPLDLLTRAFALAISVLPDRSKGPLPNSQQLRIVEARKAYLTQGMLAADILSGLAPQHNNALARAWLESEDGWAVGLLSLVPLLSVDHAAPPPASHQGVKHRDAGFDNESSKLITWRALTMLKRLAEVAGRTPSTPTPQKGGPVQDVMSNGDAAVGTNGVANDSDDLETVRTVEREFTLPRGPKWEGMPQGHAIVGALMMHGTDKVALGLLCGLHEMAMQN